MSPSNLHERSRNFQKRRRVVTNRYDEMELGGFVRCGLQPGMRPSRLRIKRTSTIGSGGFIEINRTIWHVLQIYIFAELDPMAQGGEAGQFSSPTTMTAKVENVSVRRLQVALRTGADRGQISPTHGTCEQEEMRVRFLPHWTTPQKNKKWG